MQRALIFPEYPLSFPWTPLQRVTDPSGCSTAISQNARARLGSVRSTACSFFLLAALGPELLLCVAMSPAHAQSALAPRPALLTPGIHCGFLADCTRFDQIGLHVSTGAAVPTDSPSSRWDASGAARLALTALDLAEVGVAFAGRISQAPEHDFTARLLPVSLYARLLLLLLPLPGLSLAPFRLGICLSA